MRDQGEHSGRQSEQVEDPHRCGDARGPSRRALLGAAGAAATLGAGLGARAADKDEGGRGLRAGKNPAAACILLYMNGGPSHLDTFDPKPGRRTGGEFKAIATSAEGVRISEHLPRLAERMKHVALVRSLSSKEGNHDRARHLMHTGYAPAAGADHPALGSLVAEASGRAGLPGYVAIGGPGEDSGFLPAALSPFPVRNASKPVKYLAPAKGVDEERFAARLGLLRGLEDRFAAGRGGRVAAARQALNEQAVHLMRSPGVAAFSLEQEAESVRQAYGMTDFGQGCLMARRLVEAGVPFVEVTLSGWDTHEDVFERVAALSATLDQAASALLDDLAARRLLDRTLVVWAGDFGRTPRINEKGGRDHYPQAQSAWLAGGGVRGGQVIGATDADGAAVVERPVTVPDFFRTLAHGLDLNPDKLRLAPSGRPIKTVDGGTVIPGVFREIRT
jgi:uncharacterized protein (DUF1501 family)